MWAASYYNAMLLVRHHSKLLFGFVYSQLS